MTEYVEAITNAVTGEVTVRAYTEEEIAALEANLPSAIRSDRDLRLQMDVDPIVSNVLRWNDFTDAERAAWTQYRTDLLNVPQQAGFPNSVTWPTKPS